MAAGRPRVVDDTTILRAAVAVIGRLGPAGLTLAAVASEAGVVPATLVQRFGPKRGLLLALAERSAADAARLPCRDIRGRGSALAAVADLMVARMTPMATPEAFASHLACRAAAGRARHGLGPAPGVPTRTARRAGGDA